MDTPLKGDFLIREIREISQLPESVMNNGFNYLQNQYGFDPKNSDLDDLRLVLEQLLADLIVET